tara:strand:+ start:176 stop:2797 length:2622 start_codon:yes stop_codon:yes gene_type:complete
MGKDESYTNKFSELSKASILVAGGKGANLGEMTQAGFAVPSGIVVNTGSYDAVVKANNLQDKVLSIASAVLGDNPETSESASEEIKKLFVNAQIPADIEEAIVSSYASLDGENTVVAVRSSATAEDLPDASFAGQQESYLHVQGKDQLLEAVKKCWASLWTARAITYRIKQGIAPEDVSLAAVVQQQINSDISGIAFSLNIQNNYYDEAVINSNFGLGESVVSGQVTPDHFVVNKITNKITEKVINEKQLMLVGKPDGGIEEQKIPDPKAPSLTDEQVLEVAKLVTDVETHYKVPMDIEWAIYEGKLYLLQARPITTHLPLFPELLTQPSEKKKVYIDMIVMSQGFSDSMSVLGMDYWANMLKVAKGSSMPRGKDAIVWELHGRQYLNISNMIKIGGIVTKLFSSYDAPTRQILAELGADDEYIPDEIPEPLKGYTWKAIVTALPIVRMMIPALFNVEKAQQEYMKSDAKIWKYLKEDLSRSEETFDVQAERALDMFGAMTKNLGGYAASKLADMRLKKMFKGNKEAEDLLIGLSMDLPWNPTSEMGHLMLKIASHLEFKATKSSKEFIEKLEAKKYGEEFQVLYDDYIRRFGVRGMMEIDIATPRLYENLDRVFFQLQQINTEDNAILNVERRSKEAYEKLRHIAKDMGKEKKFIKHAKTFRSMMGLREQPKYIFIVSIGILRERALVLGEQFVKAGRLDNQNQIFDLKTAQIGQAEQDSALDLRALAEENTAPYRPVAHIKDWPRIIDSRGKIHRAKRETREGELLGEGIAPGVVQGKAKVLESPYDKPLEKGEILVCRASEPSWTPIFINAAGVVMEIGGPLQHGGIIAREYGLPCVSSIDQATKLIKDGDLLEVDGSNGVVKIIKNQGG